MYCANYWPTIGAPIIVPPILALLWAVFFNSANPTWVRAQCRLERIGKYSHRLYSFSYVNNSLLSLSLSLSLSLFIFDLRLDFYISPYRRSLGRLTVRSRRLYFLVIATFNILQRSSPYYLRDLFTRFTPSLRPSRHLNPNVFAISNFPISTFRNSFYPSAIYFWHSLSDIVRSSPTIGILKGRLFRYLFDLELELNWYLYVSCGL